MFCGDKWNIGIKKKKKRYKLGDCSLPEQDFISTSKRSACVGHNHAGPEGLSPASNGGQSYGSVSDRHKPSICHAGKQTLVRQIPFLDAESHKQGLKAKAQSFIFTNNVEP